MTYDGKSDSAVLAGKLTNKAEQSAAEFGGTKGGGQGEYGSAKHVPGPGPGRRWTAYGKWQGTGRRRSSPRSSTISLSSCSGRRSSNSRRMPLPEWTGRDGETTRRISNTGSKICTHDSSGERIGRCRAGEGTYPSRTGGYARSRLPPWKTKSSRGRLSQC